MYPKNTATPPKIAIGAVVQISDGAVQSTGVSVAVSPEGGTESAGGGTITYGGSSAVVYYAPTQAETNYTAFCVTAYKTGCIPVSQTVVTSASATSGKVVLSGETHTSAVIPTVTTLTGHTAQTGDVYALANGASGFVATKADTAAILLDTGTDGVLLAAHERQSCENGQAQAGSANGITLRAAAPATNDLYLGQKVSIYAGTGCGQTRGVSSYNGTTKVITVARNWTVAPDATSYYRVEFDFGPKVNTSLEVTAAAVTGAVGSVTAGVTVTTNNDKTGYSVTGLTASNLDVAVSTLATAANLATVAGYVDTEVAAIKAKTDNLPAAFPSNFSALVITAGGIVDADIESVNGDTSAATKLERVLSGNTTGTVGTGSTTTSIVTSALSPAASVTDQFKGLILKFDDATTTAALRGQGSDITASTAGGVLTVTALTTAAVSGDIFTIS